MNGELVSTQTVDGLTLHGMLFRSRQSPHINCDLLVFIHGVGSNFYQSSLIRKAFNEFDQAGISVLSINTRGHDFVFSAGMAKTNSWLGSANEIVDECRIDVDAWTQRATNLGFQKISLFGHSLGAIKAIYSQVEQPNPLLNSVVAVSPSCLSCSFFQQSSRADEFQSCLDWAKEQVDRGKAGQISEVSFPFRLMMSPQTFLDKYGPEERYNILKLVDRVPVPLLLVMGELEVAGNNPAFEKLDARLEPVIAKSKNATLKVLPDADHYYSGVQVSLAQSIVEWIHRLG